MTALLSIDRSMVIRDGNSTYQLNRFLNDRTTIQLENQATGEYISMPMDTFHTRVRTGIYVPLSGSSNTNKAQPREMLLVDTTRLAESEKDRVAFKAAVLSALRKMGVTRGQRRSIENKLPRIVGRINQKRSEEKKALLEAPSASAVMNWMRTWEQSHRAAVALVSRNNFRKMPKRVHTVVEEAMEWALDRWYLTRDRFRLQYAFEKLQGRLRDAVANEELTADEANVSITTFHRRKEEIDPYQVAERRYGPAYARNHFRASIEGTRATRPLERVEIDHTLLNWVIVCERTGLPLGRPTLTVVIDSYSGYITGLYVSFNGPGVASVLKAIKNSVLCKDAIVQEAACTKPWIAWGIADCVIIDNGLEFHSTVFRHLHWELSTDVEYCAVRQPWLKPHVERCLLDLDMIPVGEGRVHKPVTNALPIDPRECAVITLGRFARGLAIWACDLWPHHVNSRWMAKAYDLFLDGIQRCAPPTMPVSLAGLDLIAAMHKDLAVRNGGVDLRGLTYAGPQLKELLCAAGGNHRALVKWDPDDLEYVYVQHTRTREWVALACTRPDFASGLTWNQLLTIRKALRAHGGGRDTVDHLAQTRERLRDAWLEPFARKNIPIDVEHAKRFAQLAAGAQPKPSSGSPHASRLIAQPEYAYEEHEIPIFDTSNLY